MATIVMLQPLAIRIPSSRLACIVSKLVCSSQQVYFIVEVMQIIIGNKDRDKKRKEKDSDKELSKRKEKAKRYEGTP